MTRRTTQSASRRCLQIFTKAPSLMEVKTRLSPVLSPRQRKEFYLQLLHHTLQTATKLHNTRIELWCYPDTNDSHLQKYARRHPLTLHPQQGENLGERMLSALRDAQDRELLPLLIGCDCPFIEASFLASAHKTLEQGAPSVLAPADDGGFVLIGSACPLELDALDGVQWGQASVFTDTVKRLKRLDCPPVILSKLADIDTPEDLALLRNTPLYPDFVSAI